MDELGNDGPDNGSSPIGHLARPALLQGQYRGRGFRRGAEPPSPAATLNVASAGSRTIRARASTRLGESWAALVSIRELQSTNG